MESWLKGKKTYIVAGCALVGAIAAWANDYVGGDAASVMAVLATLAMTLRAAVGKVEAPEE